MAFFASSCSPNCPAVGANALAVLAGRSIPVPEAFPRPEIRRNTTARVDAPKVLGHGLRSAHLGARKPVGSET